MEKHIKVWYDAEGDYLEVLFEKKAGFFKETENDAVMEKVDDEGKIIGFCLWSVFSPHHQTYFFTPLFPRYPLLLDMLT